MKAIVHVATCCHSWAMSQGSEDAAFDFQFGDAVLGSGISVPAPDSDPASRGHGGKCNSTDAP